VLGGGNEVEDNCSAPGEVDDAVVFRVRVTGGSARVCARVVVPRIATGLDGGRAGASIAVVVLGEDGGAVVVPEDGGAVVVPEDGGAVVVPDECRSSGSVRWAALGPGEPGNTPAKTRTATAAAATTAAPITSAATT
jgi:hypothetical protein